jgi:hypothetical protein
MAKWPTLALMLAVFVFAPASVHGTTQTESMAAVSTEPLVAVATAVTEKEADPLPSIATVTAATSQPPAPVAASPPINRLVNHASQDCGAQVCCAKRWALIFLLFFPQKALFKKIKNKINK